jgi:hypothetical protein
MIKKLILITGIVAIVGCSDVEVLIGGDNDKLCEVSKGGNFLSSEPYITENCEPNDILVIEIRPMLTSYWTSRWCRFDREIVIAERPLVDDLNLLTCVLNDITRRKGI